MCDRITFSKNPINADAEFIRDGVRKFNDKAVGDSLRKSVNIVAKNTKGEVVGGLVGVTYWGWLFVDILWVCEDHRYKKIGTRLLKLAEKEAKNRNCTNAHLYTHSFQALKFYVKNGYGIKCELKNFSQGHMKYLLTSELSNNIDEIIETDAADPITLNDNPADIEVQLIKDGIENFNYKIIGYNDHKPVYIIVRNEANEIIGGIIGGTCFGWVYIDRIWVHENYRNKGIGTRLIKLVEDEGVAIQCKMSHLFTYDFQAIEFYLNQGYETRCELKDLPRGHSKYLMIKEL